MPYDAGVMPEEVRDLTADEVEAVEGGVLWVLAGIAVGAVVVVGSYLIAESNDNQTQSTSK